MPSEQSWVINNVSWIIKKLTANKQIRESFIKNEQREKQIKLKKRTLNESTKHLHIKEEVNKQTIKRAATLPNQTNEQAKKKLFKNGNSQNIWP